MGTAIKHPVLDRAKPSFVIFDIWALPHLALLVHSSGQVIRRELSDGEPTQKTLVLLALSCSRLAKQLTSF